METYLLTANLDTRAGSGVIKSRVGISAKADTFRADDDLYERLRDACAASRVACVFVDEAQFLSKAQ
eukprot:2004157-Prymnesium_polylepis.1